MADKHKTNYPGVRFAEHTTRKHGVRPDRYFFIRYKVEGKGKEEAVGWGSQGMTAEKAHALLSAIRENIRLGIEPRSIAAMRLANQAKEEEKAKARRRQEKEAITVSEFWESTYLPTAEATKTKQTVNTEKGRFQNWIAPAIGGVPLPYSISVKHPPKYGAQWWRFCRTFEHEAPRLPPALR